MVGTSFDDMIQNNTCPQGYYCPEGTVYETNKQDCSKGRYCPEATAEELLCPPGTYNDELNAEAVDDCKPCDAG